MPLASDRPLPGRRGTFGEVTYSQTIGRPPVPKGSVPDVDDAWVVYKPELEPVEVLYTPEEMREIIRDMQNLPLSKYVLTQLTMAMNSVAELSLAAVETIKNDVLQYLQLEIHLESLEGGGSLEGINLSPDGLPMIKADVVEWSDKILGCCGKGESYFQKVLAPFKEAQARLVMKVCQALDLCAWDLELAPCCAGPDAMQVKGVTRLFRS